VLDIPQQICAERNTRKPDRAHLPPHVLQRQQRELRRSLRFLEREGFRKVHVLRSEAEVDNAEIVLEKRYNDLRHLTGPFDIVGDVHGCCDELETLLTRLGYQVVGNGDGTGLAAGPTYAHPQVRKAFEQFLGALSDPRRGTSARIGRAILLAEPPSLDVGEVTDKGSINQRAVLAHRAALVEELYADPPSANVIVAASLSSPASAERPGWRPTAQAS